MGCWGRRGARDTGSGRVSEDLSMACSAELDRELGDRQVKEGNRVPGDDDGAAIGTKVTWRDMLEEVAFSLT